MSYINAGDTLTIQLQGIGPGFLTTNNFGSFFSGTDQSVYLAQQIANSLNGQGLATAIDSASTNTDGTVLVQVDVTAGQDYASDADVLAIAENAWSNAVGSLPSSAVVTDINGRSTGAGAVQSTGAASLIGQLQNVNLSNVASGLQSFGVTTLVFIVVIIVALLLFLSSEGGQRTARLFV